MIENLLNDMKNAKENKIYYAAMALALMIPDICGKIQYSKGNDKEKYIRWFDEWIYKYFEFPKSKYDQFDFYDEQAKFDGKVCYALRCAYLHAGNSDLQKSKGMGEPLLRIEFCVSNEEFQYGDSHGCRISDGELVDVHRRFNIENLLDAFLLGTKDYIMKYGDAPENCVPFVIYEI